MGVQGRGNWGTLRIPREDWGTLGKIRGITTPPPLRNLLNMDAVPVTDTGSQLVYRAQAAATVLGDLTGLQFKPKDGG